MLSGQHGPLQPPQGQGNRCAMAVAGPHGGIIQMVLLPSHGQTYQAGPPSRAVDVCHWHKHSARRASIQQFLPMIYGLTGEKCVCPVLCFALNTHNTHVVAMTVLSSKYTLYLILRFNFYLRPPKKTYLIPQTDFCCFSSPRHDNRYSNPGME